MLVGLASKNAILIVEFANHLKLSGLSPEEAVKGACETRFRPILMTSLAFVSGILPLVFATGAGAASRHSLGTAVCGGMIFSTVLSLYIVPVIYLTVGAIREKMVGRKDRSEDKGPVASGPPADAHTHGGVELGAKGHSEESPGL